MTCVYCKQRCVKGAGCNCSLCMRNSYSGGKDCGCRKCKMAKYGIGGYESQEGAHLIDTYRAQPIPASVLKFRPKYPYADYGFSVRDQVNKAYR